jgi:hypothetical protein
VSEPEGSALYWTWVFFQAVIVLVSYELIVKHFFPSDGLVNYVQLRSIIYLESCSVFFVNLCPTPASLIKTVVLLGVCCWIWHLTKLIINTFVTAVITAVVFITTNTFMCLSVICSAINPFTVGDRWAAYLERRKLAEWQRNLIPEAPPMPTEFIHTEDKVVKKDGSYSTVKSAVVNGRELLFENTPSSASTTRVAEGLVATSTIMSAQMLPYMFYCFNELGNAIGGGVRVGNTGITALHLFSDGLYSIGKEWLKSIPIKREDREKVQAWKGLDCAILRLTPAEWSMCGVSAKGGVLGPAVEGSVTANGFAVNNGMRTSRKSYGQLVGRLEGHPGQYKITASSLPGWCGFPHIQRYKNRDVIIGIHLASERSNVNGEVMVVNVGLDLSLLWNSSWLTDEADHIIGFSRSYSYESWTTKDKKIHEQMEAWSRERGIVFATEDEDYAVGYYKGQYYPMSDEDEWDDQFDDDRYDSRYDIAEERMLDRAFGNQTSYMHEGLDGPDGTAVAVTAEPEVAVAAAAEPKAAVAATVEPKAAEVVSSVVVETATMGPKEPEEDEATLIARAQRAVEERSMDEGALRKDHALALKAARAALDKKISDQKVEEGDVEKYMAEIKAIDSKHAAAMARVQEAREMKKRDVTLKKALALESTFIKQMEQLGMNVTVILSEKESAVGSGSAFGSATAETGTPSQQLGTSSAVSTGESSKAAAAKLMEQSKSAVAMPPAVAEMLMAEVSELKKLLHALSSESGGTPHPGSGPSGKPSPSKSAESGQSFREQESNQKNGSAQKQQKSDGAKKKPISADKLAKITAEKSAKIAAMKKEDIQKELREQAAQRKASHERQEMLLAALRTKSSAEPDEPTESGASA